MEENLAILTAVSRIVAYAHERRRIVHCDLKPENVMLGENNGRYNDIYLVDWGLALWLDDPNLAEKTVGGADYYRAPETCLQDATAIACATDVFTLGGILFRLLASCAPYQEACRQKGKLRASLVDIPSANVPEIPERCPKTGAINPPELVEIARKALRKAPEERYANAAEFADALERYRRRASLGERFRAAQDSFERLRREVENAPNLSTTRKFASLFTGRLRRFRRDAAYSNDERIAASARRNGAFGRRRTTLATLLGRGRNARPAVKRRRRSFVRRPASLA